MILKRRMWKKGVFGIAAIVLMAMLSVIPPKTIGQNDASKWMKQIHDNTKITELSIPGSHDSGATHSIADVAGKCQTLSITSQLHIGIRFLDIRLQLENDTLKVVHSFVDQSLTFESVITDLVTFIKENPSEFLIVSIKEDNDAVNPSMSFAQCVEQQLGQYCDIIQDDNTLPQTVGEARGKIYLLSRYADASMGIYASQGWRDSQTFVLKDLYVQDNYCISNIEEKQTDIERAISAHKKYPDKLLLNFTSCYLDHGFPPSYAGTTAKELNVWFVDSIEKWEGPLGIVIGDFVTSDWAKGIYEKNK